MLRPFLQSPGADLVLRQALQEWDDLPRSLHSPEAMQEAMTEYLLGRSTKAFTTPFEQPLLLAIIRAHVHRMREMDEEVQSKLPELQAGAVALFDRAIEQGKIPLDPDWMRRRLAFARVCMLDPAVAHTSMLGGVYEPFSHGIALSAVLRPESWFNAYVYAAIFALAGRSEMLNYDDRPVTIREGLYLPTLEPEDVHDDEDDSERFMWLNHMVALSVFEDLQSVSTPRAETKFIRLLERQGVPRAAIVEAFFEQDRPTAFVNDVAGPTPAFRRLLERMHYHLGAGMLARIDDLVSRAGNVGVPWTEVLAGVNSVMEQRPQDLSRYVANATEEYERLDDPEGDA